MESQPRNVLASIIDWLTKGLGQILVSIAVPLVAFYVMWQGFIFLRDGEASQLVTVVVAIIWGVGGIGLLYFLANWIIDRLPDNIATSIRPYAFVGPALVILGWFLFIPTLRTLYASFFDATTTNFVGFDNYVFAFTDARMLESFRNNLIWLIVGTGLSVVFGTLVAVLADRSDFEVVAKSLIFLPMAISFVGAGVIWRFIYAYRPPGADQIGLLNAIVTAFGGEPQAWLTIQPWNTLFMVAILVWLQTGYAMVLISAALKGVPEELLEAARIDGANEIRIFFNILLPSIQQTIITVSTTIIILTLKIFDIVFVMTNGNFGTEVMASQQYKQMFRFQDFGRGSAVAIVLLIAVIPVMWYNLKQFGQKEAF
jgi:alpha-glucoside transport system permease protein